MKKTPSTQPLISKQKELTTIPVTTRVVAPLITQAADLSITSPTSLTLAVEFLSRANSYLDRVVEYKKSKTDPINKALKIIREETKPLEDLLSGVITTTKGKISRYHTEESARVARAEEAIASRVAPGRGNLSEETAVRKIEELDRPLATVASAAGTVTFRTDKKLKITDYDKLMLAIASRIPSDSSILALVELNESALLSYLKAGNELPGAIVEEVKTVINARARH